MSWPPILENVLEEEMPPPPTPPLIKSRRSASAAKEKQEEEEKRVLTSYSNYFLSHTSCIIQYLYERLQVHITRPIFPPVLHEHDHH